MLDVVEHWHEVLEPSVSAFAGHLEVEFPEAGPENCGEGVGRGIWRHPEGDTAVVCANGGDHSVEKVGVYDGFHDG